jgi:hypothetical protein
MSTIADLLRDKPVKTIDVNVRQKFEKLFTHEKNKHILVLGQSGYGKTVTNKRLAEFYLDFIPDSLAVSVDEKNEYYPFRPQTRPKMLEALEKWNDTPNCYKSFILIPFTGEKYLPTELPKSGWHYIDDDTNKPCYIQYCTIPEDDLDYVDKVALLTGKKGRPKPAVAEWILEAEMYLENRNRKVTKENLMNVLMRAKEISPAMKRSIKHCIMDMTTDETVGMKHPLDMNAVLHFCIKHDIRWINVCTYFFTAGQRLERIVFIKHMMQQLYTVKRHKEILNPVIICIPELHTYLSVRGYKDKYLAREVFIDVLSKGRSLGVKLIGDTQYGLLLPKLSYDYFDTCLLHNVKSSDEIFIFCQRRLGISGFENIKHASECMIHNLLTGDLKFQHTRAGFYHLLTLWHKLKIGSCIIVDYDNKLHYMEDLRFPPARQFHEDKTFKPYEKKLVPKEEIVDLFKDDELDWKKYELLSIKEET